MVRGMLWSFRYVKSKIAKIAKSMCMKNKPTPAQPAPSPSASHVLPKMLSQILHLDMKENGEMGFLMEEASSTIPMVTSTAANGWEERNLAMAT